MERQNVRAAQVSVRDVLSAQENKVTLDAATEGRVSSIEEIKAKMLALLRILEAAQASAPTYQQRGPPPVITDQAPLQPVNCWNKNLVETGIDMLPQLPVTDLEAHSHFQSPESSCIGPEIGSFTQEEVCKDITEEYEQFLRQISLVHHSLHHSLSSASKAPLQHILHDSKSADSKTVETRRQKNSKRKLTQESSLPFVSHKGKGCRDNSGRPGGHQQHQNFTPLNTSRTKVLVAIRNHPSLQRPRPLAPNSGDQSKYCDYHQGFGHKTENCSRLKQEIERFVRMGLLEKFLQNKGHGPANLE